LLTIRIALLGLAGLAWLGRAQPAMMPSFDRFGSLMGIVLLAWALQLPRPNLRQYLLFLGVGMGLAGLVATPFVVTLHPPGTPFNHTYADAGWSISLLLFSLVATYSLLSRRPPGWDLALAPFGLLLSGALLHIAMGPSDQDLPAFIRLAEMGAYPLFAVTAARVQVQESLSSPGELLAGEGAGGAGSLMDAAALFSQQLTARDPLELAYQASGLLAEHLEAGLCFIFSAQEGDQIELAAGYIASEERHLTGTILEAAQMPLLASALRGRRTLHANQEHPLPDLETLSQVLGLTIELPAMIIPLRANRQNVGAVLLAGPRDQYWRPQQLQIAGWATAFVATRLLELQHGALPAGATAGGIPASALSQVQQRARELERENQALRQRLHALEALQESPSQPDPQLEAQLAQAKQTIRRLQQELSDLRYQAASMQAEEPEAPKAQETQNQLFMALQELAEARRKLQQLEKETAAAAQATSATAPQLDLEALVRIVQQLRQPTSTILGYTDVLLGESVGLLGAMQRQFLERVQNASRQIGELLNELTRAAAIEAADFSLLPEPVDMAHCLDEAITQISDLIREKAITLRVDISEDLPPMMGDQETLTSIATHLLRNALGATPEQGQVSLLADAQRTEDGDYLLLSVSDQGPGVPSEFLPRVFQMTYGGTKSLVPGLGIQATDLASTRTMVEMLGGRIWIDSEEGSGSTFTVLLPCSQQAESAAPS
jgi:signal transduction histidine kinase